MLSKRILTAKIMRKINFKIEMLAGKRLKIRAGASFEISSTLVHEKSFLEDYLLNSEQVVQKISRSGELEKVLSYK